MKPTEYIGTNGFVYSWEQSGSYVRLMATTDSEPHMVAKTDARAAGHALIALADELETEAVELERTDSGCIYELINPPNGPHYIRWRYLTDDRTGVCNVEVGRFTLAAYRAGLAKGTP